MALLVAEQTAENAKTVNQGNPGFHYARQDPSLIKLHNTPFSQCSNPFSRCKACECHGVSEQLMAAGATEEDVKKISQVMAQTVRTLETGIATPEPGPEAHSLPCEVVGSDEEFSDGFCIPGFSKIDTERTRSHQEELVKRHHGKEAIGEEMQAGRRRFAACSVSGSGPNSLQCPSILRFPELVKRITLDLRTPQRSCLANNSSNWPVGYEFDQ